MINPEKIIEVVCDHFGVNIEKITQKHGQAGAKQQQIVVARQAAMRLLRENTFLGLKNIGEYFSNRDHSTVHCAIKSIQDRIDTSREFRRFYKELEDKISDLTEVKIESPEHLWQKRESKLFV